MIDFLKQKTTEIYKTQRAFCEKYDIRQGDFIRRLSSVESSIKRVNLFLKRLNLKLIIVSINEKKHDYES